MTDVAFLSKNPSLSLALLVSSLAATGLAYAAFKFVTRVAPTIPYAGEESLGARLRVPLEYGKDPVDFLCRTRKKLGDVFCVDLFVLKVVFVLGPEANRIILRAPEEKLSFWTAVRRLQPPQFSTSLDVDGWLELSLKIVKRALLKQEHLRNFTANCDIVSNEHFGKWADHGSIPLFRSFSELVLSYLVTLFLGHDFYLRHGRELVPLMDNYERELQKPILQTLPFALWRLTGPGRFLHGVITRLDELIKLELRDIHDNPEKNEGRSDYFYFLVMQLGDQAERFLPCLGTHVASIIFGGHANVAMSIPWLFLHARRTPGCLERLREEAVTLAREERKPYTEACFRETGRLYSGTSFFRWACEPTVVKGHNIPKGTMIGFSPAATHREDKDSGGVYDNAAHWKPDRFLEDPSAYARWFKSGEFVQFGLGQHACPGEKLARSLIFDYVLKAWMGHYDIEVVSGLEEGVKGLDDVGAEPAWTEENFGTPSIRGEDVQVRVTRRGSAPGRA